MISLKKWGWPLKTLFKGLLWGSVFILIISFQNCGKNNLSNSEVDDLVNASSAYVDMNSSEAERIFAGYQNYCNTNSNVTFQRVQSGASVSLSGQPFVGIAEGEIPLVSGMGNLFLRAESGNALIRKISSFSGNITLCNLSVETLTGEKTYANIYLEGGALTSVDSFYGNVIINGDRFPENVRRFFGNIIVKTSGGQVLGRTYAR